jgi:ribosomal protein S18 acetylase RimI-like enzyme
MPIAQIIDMPGAGTREYDEAFALIHPNGSWPEGQLHHIAGPTPDGFRVIDVWQSREAFERFARDVLAPLGLAGLEGAGFPVHRLLDTAHPAPATVRVQEHQGSRAQLRPLFELAEDSAQALAGYIHEGRVLVARDGERIVGHLQVVNTAGRGAEIKNMAVLRSYQRRGVGRALVTAAIDLARRDGCSALVVATAAADTGNLRFYQRLGFRMRSIERDAFTVATGYAAGLRVDGIELRDRVWLDRAI